MMATVTENSAKEVTKCSRFLKMENRREVASKMRTLRRIYCPSTSVLARRGLVRGRRLLECSVV